MIINFKNMGYESFDPNKHGNRSELPEEKRDGFVDVENGGFVRKEAKEAEELAEIMALARKDGEDARDILKLQAENYDGRRKAALEYIENYKDNGNPGSRYRADIKLSKLMGEEPEQRRDFFGDKPFIIKALKKFPDLFFNRDFPESLRVNKEIFIAMLDGDRINLFDLSRKIHEGSLPKELLTDRDVALKFTEKYPMLAIEVPEILEAFKDDSEFILKLCKAFGTEEGLKFAGDKIRRKLESLESSL